MNASERASRYDMLVRSAKQSDAERIAADELAQHVYRAAPQQPGRKFAAQCVVRVDGGKVCGRDYFAAVHTIETTR